MSYFIPVILAIQFDDLLQRVSDCFSGKEGVGNTLWSFALSPPLSKDTLVSRVKWLVNTSVAALKWSYDTLPSVIDYVARIAVSYLGYTFKALVNWNRKTLPIVAAWLLATDTSTAVTLIRAHRQTILLVSALICIASSLPGTILTALGFGVSGIRRGSPAATYQRNTYGGFTPASSPFAKLQSAGMKYHDVLSLVPMIISLSAGLLFIFAWNLE
ncbi:hypothetical protein B0H13DRAFT_2687743 [Mycena leptocephala]|nr:hypothetical protein B0H13DRAFT_2687743 [Mycena leptocephala]